MKKSVSCFVFFFAILITLQTKADDQFLYLVAGGEITVYGIDRETGKLNSIESNELPGAGPLTFSHDGSKLYAMASENNQSQMATFERKPNGKLELIQKSDINLRAGYLDVDQTGDFIAGNHYREGKVSLWKLQDGVYRGETAQELELEPKAHGANFSRNNRWLLVPATGPNKVFVNVFDPDAATITPHDPPFATAPMAENQARHPRHLVFHSKLAGVVYTTNESKNPGVCVWRWDDEKGTLKPIQNVVTLPENFKERVSTSTLHLTPDARFLYVANRSKKGQSSIVCLSVDKETGMLKLLDHFPCESVPRSFCIDKTGRFIYVAGQADQRLGVYKINQNTGGLEKVEQLNTGKNPFWVEAR